MSEQLDKFIRKGEDPNEILLLDEELAEGSFGTVYKGRIAATNQVVAVKIIQLEGEETFDDLAIELEVMSQCNSPNIVQYWGSWSLGDELFIAMEYCDGGSASDVYSILDQPLSEPEIKAVIQESLKGLVYLQGLGYIHRDIKAGNILLKTSGEVKLIDFGVSGKVTPQRPKRNTFIGTPFWMAPEVIENKMASSPYDFKADVWSIGITVIELAECQPPLADIPPMKALFQIPYRDSPTLEKPSEWSKEMNEFLALCVEKDPNKRPSFDQLLLHKWLQNTEVKPVIADLVKRYLVERKRLEDEEMGQVAEEADAEEIQAQQLLEKIENDKSPSVVNAIAASEETLEKINELTTAAPDTPTASTSPSPFSSTDSQNSTISSLSQSQQQCAPKLPSQQHSLPPPPQAPSQPPSRGSFPQIPPSTSFPPPPKQGSNSPIVPPSRPAFSSTPPPPKPSTQYAAPPPHPAAPTCKAPPPLSPPPHLSKPQGSCTPPSCQETSTSPPSTPRWTPSTGFKQAQPNPPQIDTRAPPRPVRSSSISAHPLPPSPALPQTPSSQQPQSQLSSQTELQSSRSSSSPQMPLQSPAQQPQAPPIAPPQNTEAFPVSSAEPVTPTDTKTAQHTTRNQTQRPGPNGRPTIRYKTTTRRAAQIKQIINQKLTKQYLRDTKQMQKKQEAALATLNQKLAQDKNRQLRVLHERQARDSQRKAKELELLKKQQDNEHTVATKKLKADFELAKINNDKTLKVWLKEITAYQHTHQRETDAFLDETAKKDRKEFKKSISSTSSKTIQKLSKEDFKLDQQHSNKEKIFDLTNSQEVRKEYDSSRMMLTLKHQTFVTMLNTFDTINKHEYEAAELYNSTEFSNLIASQEELTSIKVEERKIERGIMTECHNLEMLNLQQRLELELAQHKRQQDYETKERTKEIKGKHDKQFQDFKNAKKKVLKKNEYKEEEKHILENIRNEQHQFEQQDLERRLAGDQLIKEQHDQIKDKAEKKWREDSKARQKEMMNEASAMMETFRKEKEELLHKHLATLLKIVKQHYNDKVQMVQDISTSVINKREEMFQSEKQVLRAKAEEKAKLAEAQFTAKMSMHKSKVENVGKRGYKDLDPSKLKQEEIDIKINRTNALSRIANDYCHELEMLYSNELNEIAEIETEKATLLAKFQTDCQAKTAELNAQFEEKFKEYQQIATPQVPQE